MDVPGVGIAMSSKLRTPALVAALVAAVLVVGVELGGTFRASKSTFGSLGNRLAALKQTIGTLGASGADKINSQVGDFPALEQLLGTEAQAPSSYAVAALITIDSILLFTLIMFNLPLLVSPRLVAQLQGLLSVIVGIGVILYALFTLLKVLVLVFLMLGLLLALPFGTIVYMILYGHFDTREAAAIMSTLMFLKVALTVALLIAHERFLLNIGLIALIASSIIAMIVISFLHNFLPGFLVSITDGIGAIVVTVIAIIWGIILVIGGIMGILTALRGLGSATT